MNITIPIPVPTEKNGIPIALEALRKLFPIKVPVKK